MLRYTESECQALKATSSGTPSQIVMLSVAQSLLHRVGSGIQWHILRYTEFDYQALSGTSNSLLESVNQSPYFIPICLTGTCASGFGVCCFGNYCIINNQSFLLKKKTTEKLNLFHNVSIDVYYLHVQCMVSN